MSVFTLPLKTVLAYADIPVTYEVVEFKGESFGLLPVMGPSEWGVQTGLESYPIHDEDYRRVLNGKILDRYWNREIGQESVDMFFHALRRWLNENMPYYNKMYADITFEHGMQTVNMKTTNTGTSNQTQNTTGNSNSTNTTGSNAKTFTNEMPQTAMSEDESYATSAVEAESTTTVTGSGSETGEATTSATQGGDSETIGRQGNAGDILASYRASILNVDRIVLDAMSELFMQIWRTSDAGTPNEYVKGLIR